MDTGAESPGLSCPLDVDLFPAYSDDSPLCDCSFGCFPPAPPPPPRSLEIAFFSFPFRFLFVFFSFFFAFLAYIAWSFNLHSPQNISSLLLPGKLDAMDTAMFVLWAYSWVSYLFFFPIPCSSQVHWSLVLIVWRYRFLMCMDSLGLISGTCRCWCLCMVGSSVGLPGFRLIFTVSFT